VFDLGQRRELTPGADAGYLCSMSEATIDNIKTSIQSARSRPVFVHDDFRREIMGSVLGAIPGTPERWSKTSEVEKAAVNAVRNGIKEACQISVALAATKEEAEGYISQAGLQLLSGDKQAMGLHLSARLESLDKEVCRAERSGWANYSPEQKQFVEEKFMGLCGKLNQAALDPDLIEHSRELRRQLFPKLEGAAAEYHRDRPSGSLSYRGPKGIGDLVDSHTGKNGAGLYAPGAQQPGVSGSPHLDPDSLSIRGLKTGGVGAQGRRREDSPNVCQR